MVGQQYTVDDFIKLNPTYKKSWDPTTNTATITNTSNNKSINFGINQGQQYGLGTAENPTGSHYITDVNKFTSSLSGDQVQAQYKSPYQQSIDSLATQISARPQFKYNPNNDNALKQAQGQATQNVMESMNERGILNSTVTSDRVAQEVANLVPQYEQLAYQRYNDETENLVNKLNVLNTLDTKSYQIYQDAIQNKYNQDKFEYQKTQDQIVNDRNKINDAWSKVQNTGYVDNETSIILGIPVGTPSWEAKKAADDRKHELDVMEKDNTNKMSIIDKQHANDIEVINIKNKQDQENATTQFERDKELKGIDANNAINLENVRAANDINLENVNATNDRNLAQIKSDNSINSSDLMKNASNYINTYFTSKDENGNSVLTMQNKRDIANYIYNLATSGSVSEEVSDALFVQYDINYDFLKEMGLAN